MCTLAFLVGFCVLVLRCRRSTSFDFLLRCGQKFGLVALLCGISVFQKGVSLLKNIVVCERRLKYVLVSPVNFVDVFGITFLSIKCSRCVVCHGR